MPESLDQTFVQQDGSPNKEVADTKAESVERGEQSENVEAPPSESETAAKLELARKDEQRLAEVRGALRVETEKNNGFEVVRKPREQWEQEPEIATDSPVDRVRGWFRSFSKTETEARRVNGELQRELNEDRAKYSEIGFDYEKGVGVEGMVGNKVGILATGFGECSGLVFQTPDKVAVVHISPNVFKDPSEGGEIVREKDVWGHIRSALKELLRKEQKEGETTKKTDSDSELRPEEIDELQRVVDSGGLKSTMLSGEDSLVPNEIATVLGKFARSNNLPAMKTEIHYVGATGGGGGYAIYANPEEVYFIGSNGKMMKKGENLPPTMYEYREKK